MSESPTGSIDALWESLAPHVEWPDGFSLVIVFAWQPAPVDELRARLEHSLRARAKQLIPLRPTRAEDVGALAPQLLNMIPAECGALWVELWRGGGDPAWDSAVRGLLERLNERRYLLERDVRVPVVLVLPPQARSSLHDIAPDLWTIRSFSSDLPHPVEKPSRAQTSVLRELHTAGDVQRLVEELARVFDPDDARRLAKLIGLPWSRLPRFTTARVFWDKVIREIQEGAVPGVELQHLAEIADSLFPRNSVFKRFAGRGQRYGE